MSARQNKKRKGRNNLNNRERTVTTFTEDPNTSFLVPLPSEEPAVMSNNPNNVPFQIPPNFGISYNYMAPQPQQPQQQQPQQPQFFPSQVMLPPGKNDLEVLENLKTMIKEGQHEFYRAIPQPAALASLYLGPTAGQPHPEQQQQQYQQQQQQQQHHHHHHQQQQQQHPSDYHSPYNHTRYDNSTPENLNPPYPTDPNRRPSDPTLKDAWKSTTIVNVHILAIT